MKYISCAALLFCVLTAGACTDTSGIDGSLSGLRPVMQPQKVGASTESYLTVRNIFIRRAAVDGRSGEYWYQVARAGYGYVDEQCSDYLGKLRDLRIARDTTRAQLASVQTTSNAILGIVGASKVAIGVTAASLGLASQVSDNATINLLYAMEPSDIEGIIKSQTQEYRRIAEQQRAGFTDSTVAMDSIRGYLNICLPVSIEAQVKAAVRNTTYVATSSSPGAMTLTQVATGSAGVPSVMVLRNGGGTRYRPSDPGSNAAKGLTDRDVKIKVTEAKEIQRNLCVTPTGDLGGVGSDTRKAIFEFQNLTATADAAGKAVPATGDLDPITLYNVVNLGSCSGHWYKTVFERKSLSSPKEVAAAQKRLADFVKDPGNGFSADVASLVDDKFIGGDALTEKNRTVIRAVKVKLGQPATDTYTAQLQNELLRRAH